MKKLVILALSFTSSFLCSMSYRYDLGANKILVLKQGNIIDSSCDVIVNAANCKLQEGDGVCGAIFEAAGRDQLKEACSGFGICPVGQCQITPSYNLKNIGSKKIKKIIHAVGPDCRIEKDIDEQNKLLRNVYQQSLLLANDVEDITLQSIAFPFISSGIYEFPKDRAANIALRSCVDTVLKYCPNVNEIHFVLYSKEDLDYFVKAAKDLKLNPIKDVKLNPVAESESWIFRNSRKIGCVVTLCAIVSLGLWLYKK